MKENKNCKNCDGFCPSGLDKTELCNSCQLIGTKVQVRWGRFGNVSALVEHVTKFGNIYASRWNKRQGCRTEPKMIEAYQGGWRLAH